MKTIHFILTILMSLNASALPLEIDLDLETDTQVAGSAAMESNQDVRAVRTAFEKALSEYLTADESVKVLFWPTSREEVLNGRFSRVDIRFRSGRMQGVEDLIVSRGQVTIKDLDFDLNTLMSQDKLVIKKVGDMAFRMRVNEDDLNAFLEGSQKRLNLQYPRVELKDGRMYFVARVRTLFFNSRVRTEGSFLVNRENQTVDFRASNVSLNSLPVPGFVVGNLLDRINPILNLKRFPLVEQINIELDDIRIQPGYIELSGT